MVWDFILRFIRVLEQHILCIHEYSYKWKLDCQYESCDICGKLK